MNVGFVGTGNMGRPMAANILKAGHQMTVYDLRAEATAPLERAGATPRHRPAGAGAGRARDHAEPSRCARGGGRALRQLRRARPHGGCAERRLLLRSLHRGTRQHAEPGRPRGAARLRLVDAPVSGSVSGAEAGTLAVMIGAPEADAKPFESILRAIGKNLFFLGEVGKGNILKLLNNYVALTNQAALCEAMALADRLGVPRQTVGDVVGKSSGASFILERKLAALVQHDYKAGFFVDLARKDLGLGLDLAKEVKGESVVGRAAWDLYGRASEAGFGRLDTCGLLGLLEPRAIP